MNQEAVNRSINGKTVDYVVINDQTVHITMKDGTVYKIANSGGLLWMNRVSK